MFAGGADGARHQCRADRLYAGAGRHRWTRSSAKSTPWIWTSWPGNCPRLAATPGGIVVSGWSAGGHLTSMALSHPKVKAGLAISGIFDLEPIRHSYLNEKLRADEATSRRNSPMMQEGGPPKPLSLVVGSAELPLLRKQTADFAGHRARYGLPVTYEEIPDANHFTIMYEMMSPRGRITTLIRQLFERTTG